MKRITWLGATTAAVAVALAAGMSSCAKEKALVDLPEGEECRLALTASTIETKGASVATKATETLPAGMEVGVHIVDLTSKETLTTATKWVNLKHVTDASGGLVYQTDASGLPIILTTGYVYDIHAYSPYQAGLTAAGTTQIPVSHGTDLLWAKTTGEKPNAATHKANLVFEHRMARVAFQVVADAASTPDITGATIKVTGFYGDGKLDLASGKITPGTVDNTIELTETGKAICFVPREGDMELNVEVTVPAPSLNAGTYAGVIKQTFNPGESVDITVTVIDRNSELGISAQVVKWVDKTGSVDVNN